VSRPSASIYSLRTGFKKIRFLTSCGYAKSLYGIKLVARQVDIQVRPSHEIFSIANILTENSTICKKNTTTTHIFRAMCCDPSTIKDVTGNDNLSVIVQSEGLLEVWTKKALPDVPTEFDIHNVTSRFHY
jgi:hypothetical protein